MFEMVGLEAIRNNIRTVHEKLESLNTGEFSGDIDNLVTRAYRRVKDLTPKKSGVIQASWRWTKERLGKDLSYVWIIYNEREGDDPNILKFLEWGTKPHEIVPKKGSGVLVFQTKGGETIFTKHIDHPGTRPYAMVAITKSEFSGHLGNVSQAWANRLKTLWKGRGI